MKISLEKLRSQIPGSPTDQWPDGVRYAVGFEHGTMTLEFYAPVGTDPQQPHKRDELYIIQSGTSDFQLGDETMSVTAGDAIFVPAGAEHRFVEFSADFATWVIFWGPEGGESNQTKE